MKVINSLVLLWAVLLAALFVYATPLGEALWIAYLPIRYLPLLGGVVLLLFAADRGYKKGWRSALPAIVVLCGGLLLFFGPGFKLGRWAYFQTQKAHYEGLLAETIRSDAIPGDEGYIDEGPPVRYAFYFQRGVIDNWVGAVYDPTGAVMQIDQAKGWDELRHPGLQNVVGLFGGDLYSAEDMGGGWYLCWFT